MYARPGPAGCLASGTDHAAPLATPPPVCYRPPMQWFIKNVFSEPLYRIRVFFRNLFGFNRLP